jgi:hypothetical protein
LLLWGSIYLTPWVPLLRHTGSRWQIPGTGILDGSVEICVVCRSVLYYSWMAVTADTTSTINVKLLIFLIN